ncbi:Mth938-like domain-containing protein [Rhodoligotrophos defluvii]|uniref:Mth938-like domain-containing protein n=1 Tax=Rhodoligotrophos defluvii TaxID=2561934 RepID=UPI0010CA0B0C|nr:Mth938-like domain-containing protein [Rhodoligotrophos defluvii]
MTERPDDQAHYPGRAPIDAYGNGGFRFAEMSHRGSILLLPSGIYGWPISSIEQLEPASFARVFAEAATIEFLLLGCGMEMRRPGPSVREAFQRHQIGLELMTTGAAARTYNVLLAEDRAVAAALIAVDDPSARR